MLLHLDQLCILGGMLMLKIDYFSLHLEENLLKDSYLSYLERNLYKLTRCLDKLIYLDGLS